MVWFIKSTQYFPKAVMEPYAGQPPSRRIYLLLDYTKYLKTTRKYLCELFPYSFWENFHSTFIRFLYPSSQQYLNTRLIDMAEEITFTALKHISAFFRWVETWHQTFPICWSGFSRNREYYFFLLRVVNLVNDARAVHVRIKKLKWWARDSAAEDFSTSCPVEAKVLIIAYSLLTTE